MQPESVVPGFERLLAVCRRRAHPVKLEPPLPREARGEAWVAGQPVDSQLAAVHARAGYLWVKDEFFLLPARHERRPDLHRVNEHWRREWVAPFGSLLVFAKDDRLAYCYATVPALADGTGPQPVVWVDVYEDVYAVPVASDVDHFFDTYARYLETARSEAEDEEATFPPRAFPWRASRLIARDRALLERMRAGHFDSWMKASDRAREWADQMLDASVRR